jgi:hypothetical protein
VIWPDARERAALGAAGADRISNEETAQRLFITIKALAVPLSHACCKLAIRPRAQLDKGLLDAPAPSPSSTSA